MILKLITFKDDTVPSFENSSLQKKIFGKLNAHHNVTEFFYAKINGLHHIYLFSEPLKESRILLDVLDKLLDVDFSAAKFSDYNEKESVEHFLRFANGLLQDDTYNKSAVEIIKTFNEDFNEAKQNGTIGPVFQRLFQRAIWLHEKVRMNTNFFLVPVKPPQIFCQLAEKIYESLDNIVVQLIGEDQHLLHYIEELSNFGCRKFLFTDSQKDNLEKIETLIPEHVHFKKVDTLLTPDTDILIIANEQAGVIDKQQYQKRMALKHKLPLLVLGLSNLRNPISADSYNVYSYQQADLESIARTNKQQRFEISKHIMPWLEQEVEEFIIWMTGTGSHYNFENIIGHSAEMQDIFELISRISHTDITVLIQGESGTGKELISRAIHRQSMRAEKPFVVVNCGAIPVNLLESELFGHVRGSFTGAVANKYGLFYEARNGTIFLDEIAELPQLLQVKLLRFLQEGDIKQVGSNEIKKIDVRVIAATNRNLKQMVDEGTFRSDLFYRLNVILVELPPLRERKEDVVLLAKYFLKKYAHKYSKEVKEFSAESMDIIKKYHWPGNVRELENAVEHAIALSMGKEILPFNLPDSIRNLNTRVHRKTVISGSPRLKDIEKQHIINTLAETSWDYERVCSILGIGRTTLWRKIKEYGIKQ